jgi:hypothetical protein
MNIAPLLLLVALLTPQEAFTRFTFCHDFPSGLYEKQCIDLKPDGTGQARIKRRDADETQSAVTLSPSGKDKFLSVIAATRDLADRQNYETKKKVANLGRKHITLEMPSGKREADFNYSDLKEVNALTAFFDGLLNQQTLVSDLEAAAQYQRLSVPERLEQLENEVKSGRIGDPPGLIPALDKIIGNERILDYARQHAQQMKSQLLIAK